MIAVLFIVAVLWFGFVLDDLFGLSRGDFLVRLAAAVALGCFGGAWIVFLISCVFGFGYPSVFLGLGLILGFNAVAWITRKRDFAWFASLRRFDRTFWLFSAVPVVLLTAYFTVCVRFDADGNIRFDGNTQDLAFHMATVSAFLNQDVFPPLNPQSGAAKLSYHFMANFFSAILCKGGFSLFYSIKIPMVLSAFALGTLVGRIFISTLRSRPAASIAGLQFFFGHVGVINQHFGLVGYPSGNGPVQLGSWANVEDHLLYPYFNFLNVVIDYFQPQLPFLIAFPLAALVLIALHHRFVNGSPLDKTAWLLLAVISFFPLFHIHSFLTLFPLVGLFILFARRPPPVVTQAPRLNWITQLLQKTLPPEALPSIAPVPRSTPALWQRTFVLKLLGLSLAILVVGLQLAFIFSQEKTAGFSGFDVAAHLGALPEIPDIPGLKRTLFWVRAAGLPFILGIIGFVLVLARFRSQDLVSRRHTLALAALFLTGTFYFFVINFYRFSPNWGDSNKFFLYWNLALCACSGWLLSLLWSGSRVRRAVVVTLVALGAIIPSAVEWTERASRQSEYLFTASDRLVADWIALNTPPDAVFLTANNTVHLVPALAGRRVVNGAYTRETGFGGEAIESLVAQAYREADPSLITSLRVTHVIVGPDEEGRYHINHPTWSRRHKVVYDQSSRNVRYTIYEVRDLSPDELRREREKENSRPFIWLSELTPTYVSQFGPLRYDKAFSLDPLILAKREFSHGLGTHAPSELHFDLDGRYTSFESVVGLDDSQAGGIGTIIFEVWVDDRRVFTSRKLRGGDLPEIVKADVTGARHLKLIVSDTGDNNHGDHANWADAKLVRIVPPSAPATDSPASPPPDAHNSPRTE